MHTSAIDTYAGFLNNAKSNLAPKDYYYTKVTDGYHKIQYLPTYKNYRSDIEKLRKKGLILVEKTDKLVIFKAEQENKLRNIGYASNEKAATRTPIGDRASQS